MASWLTFDDGPWSKYKPEIVVGWIVAPPAVIIWVSEPSAAPAFGPSCTSS